jgi:ribonuclease BN (tRNA processing enzyme)
MTGRVAAEVAAEAGVRQVLLTHVPYWYQPERALHDARPAFDGPLDLAKPGRTYDV